MRSHVVTLSLSSSINSFLSSLFYFFFFTTLARTASADHAVDVIHPLLPLLPPTFTTAPTTLFHLLATTCFLFILTIYLYILILTIYTLPLDFHYHSENIYQNVYNGYIYPPRLLFIYLFILPHNFFFTIQFLLLFFILIFCQIN